MKIYLCDVCKRMIEAKTNEDLSFIRFNLQGQETRKYNNNYTVCKLCTDNFIILLNTLKSNRIFYFSYPNQIQEHLEDNNK